MKNRAASWRCFLFEAWRRNEIKLRDLNFIFWECTTRCNLSCVHCGSDCSRSAAVPDMPFEDFLSALKTLRAVNQNSAITVAITGGEPLLRKDLADCGRELVRNGFGWGIVTNGLLYTESVQKELLDAGMGAVSVSIDGLEESHNALRGSAGSFAGAARAARLIAARLHRLNFDVITCAHPGNLAELPRLRDLLVSLGVPAWRIYTIAPIGRAAGNAALRLSPAEITRLFEFIAACRTDWGAAIRVEFGCGAYTGAWEEKLMPTGFFCRAGINIASVLADGSVAACPNISRAFVEGNIYSGSFEEIWRAGYAAFRDRRWTRKGVCAECGDYKHCLGGAMHLWTGEDGELLSCLHRDLAAADGQGRGAPCANLFLSPWSFVEKLRAFLH